jgi:type III restriction enzyme
MGDYSPDWAIAFQEGRVRHVYFVAETKGSLSSLQLRRVEKAKIDCAYRFFDALNAASDQAHVKYEPVETFEMLMQVVGRPNATS